MYLDCGSGNYVTGAKSWCDPYKSWEDIFNNDPIEYANLSDIEAKQVIGGEVPLWTEQADSMVIQPKLWPRASAAAERFWSPQPIWNNAGKVRQDDMFFAYKRMLIHRDRLVQRGIRASPIQPAWCKQSPAGFCWVPCTCNTTMNENYGGPNDFGFPPCTWCPNRDVSATAAPTHKTDCDCDENKSFAMTLGTVGLVLNSIIFVSVIAFFCSWHRKQQTDGNTYLLTK
eukprot:c16213_g1_i1.p1 GENE.c16213_g1_i1~~c16213_g1_i1.p1  ORF type:complete len:228 (+),score=57.56 c16213_g1_i1:310-993(+)